MIKWAQKHLLLNNMLYDNIEIQVSKDNNSHSACTSTSFLYFLNSLYIDNKLSSNIHNKYNELSMYYCTPFSKIIN